MRLRIIQAFTRGIQPFLKVYLSRSSTQQFLLNWYFRI